MIARTIAAGTHGRYLVEPPADGAAAAGLLVGFHGYAEGADAQMQRMRAIPGAGRWRLVAIQGLHRFYQRRTNEIVASWMTRQDRELAMADNAAYVSGVLDAVAHEWPDMPRVVMTGFSQGVAMTFRAAVTAARPVDGVIAVCGDIPPELDAASLARIRSALVCCGSRDEWYTAEKFDHDTRRLSEAGVRVRPIAFEGGHEWSDEVMRGASLFLDG